MEEEEPLCQVEMVVSRLTEMVQQRLGMKNDQEKREWVLTEVPVFSQASRVLLEKTEVSEKVSSVHHLSQETMSEVELLALNDSVTAELHDWGVQVRLSRPDGLAEEEAREPMGMLLEVTLYAEVELDVKGVPEEPMVAALDEMEQRVVALDVMVQRAVALDVMVQSEAELGVTELQAVGRDATGPLEGGLAGMGGLEAPMAVAPDVKEVGATERRLVREQPVKVVPGGQDQESPFLV